MPSNNVYVYPRLGRNDLGLIRFGGHGLANLMFCWANATCFAHKNGFPMIWPTWGQIKRLTLFGGFGDRRLYLNLFDRPGDAVTPIRGAVLRQFLSTTKLSPDSDLEDLAQRLKQRVANENRSHIAEFPAEWTQKVDFATLFDHHSFLKQQLIKMRPNAFKKQESSAPIAIHVRLGDLPFDGSGVLRGEPVRSHARLPIEYYRRALNKVRNNHGENLNAWVYSDGTNEELKDLLSMHNVTRQNLDTAFDEMIAMSQSNYLIGSGSTFSKWASFLSDGKTYWPPLLDHFQTKTRPELETEILNPLRIQHQLAEQ
ncbi:alpha-1,2-fucosyltransferase [Rhodopirellula sp. SWK7]|uniref:alpha-1,2-fucosyltransferase n=1 Tax=Rhodopirellula sp. SWK7 TaxID=595460 RepID=UPI0002BD6681|nr:alpha-1,2-fucosyltransferase [Rhodopirellula sp. SWK7]EMI45470.1 glycosyltransferase [Rhodopirellula sp. SWK7]